MQKTIEIIEKSLKEEKSLAVATIISHHGSTPRTSGAKMLVFDNREIYGSIGGGPVEHLVIKEALALFNKPVAFIKEFRLKPDDFNHLDALCGGTMRVLIEIIKPEKDNIDFYSRLLKAIKKGGSVLSITDLNALNKSLLSLPKCLVFKDKSCIGNFKPDEKLIKELITGIEKERIPRVLKERGFFIEPFKARETVFLFGAGHVSLALADFVKKTGFRLVVLDDRKEFANKDRFKKADKIIVPDDLKNAFEGLDINKNHYLVIMTRGHRHDKIILAQALAANARYIGMIGSKKKRNAIYASLIKEGFTEKDLAQVHCPIGLPIGGKTPEEIAVSIVAELIKERNKA